VVVERTSAHGLLCRGSRPGPRERVGDDAGVRVFYRGSPGHFGVEARVVVASIPTYLKFSATFRRDPDGGAASRAGVTVTDCCADARRSGQRSGPTPSHPRPRRPLRARPALFTLKRGSTPSRVAMPL